MTDIKFTAKEADQACEEWNFNCGPGALCAVLGMTPSEIRPHLGDFEQKGYTNPSLMASILEGLNVPFERIYQHTTTGRAEFPVYPKFGLVRIQWDGPWCDEGVPLRVRYRKTHWIVVRPGKPWTRFPNNRVDVFDVNAVQWGGWCPWKGWEDQLVPAILEACVPEASGEWWPTHCWEVKPR